MSKINIINLKLTFLEFVKLASDKKVFENLVSSIKTYLAAVTNGRVRDPEKPLARIRAFVHGTSVCLFWTG